MTRDDQLILVSAKGASFCYLLDCLYQSTALALVDGVASLQQQRQQYQHQQSLLDLFDLAETPRKSFILLLSDTSNIFQDGRSVGANAGP